MCIQTLHLCLKSWVPLPLTLSWLQPLLASVFTSSRAAHLLSAPFTLPRMCPVSSLPIHPCYLAQKALSHTVAITANIPPSALMSSTTVAPQRFPFIRILVYCVFYSILLFKCPFGNENIVHIFYKFLIIQFIHQILRKQREIKEM